VGVGVWFVGVDVWAAGSEGVGEVCVLSDVMWVASIPGLVVYWCVLGGDIVWCGVGWMVSGSGVEVWELIVVVGSLGFWVGVAKGSCIGSWEIEGWGENCIGVICGWGEY